MTPFDRLRSLTRRGGILLWMLLTACACAPFASALPAAGRTVVVPYCAAKHAAAGHRAPAPRSIALHFTAPAPGAGPFAGGWPGGALPASFEGPREARVLPAAEAAPCARLLWRRPAPRGPPATDSRI